MRALSLWQPWASLWLSGRKIHETRHWLTAYRGPLVIHAAKKLCADIDQQLEAIVVGEFGCQWAQSLPRGALIGVCELQQVRTTQAVASSRDADPVDLLCGNFTPGRYAWRAARPRAFAQSIAWRGAQRFFAVPEEIIAAALGGVPIDTAREPQQALF